MKTETNATKPSVLVVEDDPLLSNLISRKLSDEHFPLEYASTGETAKEILEKGLVPDLILLDIRLPGIDGFEVLKFVRANEATKDVPVIIFSNFGENEDVNRAKELGATKFVVKVSLSLDEVVELIGNTAKKQK